MRYKYDYLLYPVVIVWQLDIQLPVQSVPITTNVVSSNLAHGEVKNKNTTKSGQFQNQTSKIVEKDKIDPTNTQIRTDLFTFRDWYR
jgi:hypothetical protein